VKIYIFLGAGFIATLLTVFAATHFFIHSNYLEIENSHNARIQSALVQSLEDNLNYLGSIVDDHAQWDDTDDFIQGKNPDFLQINFRENSNTLQNLRISIFQFLDKYATPVAIIPPASPLGKILLPFQNSKGGGFFIWEDGLYAYHSSPITNTDASSPPSGILQGASKIDLDLLASKNKEIATIQWVSTTGKLAGKIYNIGNTKVRISETKTPKTIENFILFEQTEPNKIVGIKSTHPRALYLEGRRVMHIFLAIVSSMLVFVFSLLLLRHKELQRKKIDLEATVQKRTEALNATMFELKQAVEKLEAIAYVDELTGVQTRRSFFDTCIPWLRDAKMSDKSLSIAMMDLDDFKIINDTYGHSAGDMVLKDFCRSCEKFLDERMVLARFGGEEFVICFYGLSVKNAQEICEKIQAHIGEKLVNIAPHTKVAYTFSFGLASREEASDIDGILRLADERLYRAKERSKNLIRSR